LHHVAAGRLRRRKTPAELIAGAEYCQRDRREAKAIAFLRQRHRASALEIGAAAVKGEAWADARRAWRNKEAIGISVAVALTRSGAVRPTKGNLFEIA
jgi:hypothetical protein